MHYRAGLPGWKLAARAGATISHRVHVLKDGEAGVFVATSHDLDGLTVEAETIEELHHEVQVAADQLLTLQITASTN